MIINHINEIPSCCKYYTSSNFGEYELGFIPSQIAEIFYWYGIDSYEGMGHLLMRDDNDLWYHHNCGHCSCYGATDKIILQNSKTLKNLFEGYSQDLLDELSPIIKDLRFQKLINGGTK